MARTFLIIAERATGRVVSARPAPGGLRGLDYERVRAAVAAAYPGAAVFSPLESPPAGAAPVFLDAYLSDNRDGAGRVGGNFQEWAAAE